MADIRTSSMGGVPKGATSDRPANPSIGDVFYNGTLGCLEIYTVQGWVANSAPPGIPDIGTATYSSSGKSYNNSSASISFTAGQGGGLPNSYRATSSPGGFTGTASSSPITVSGLQSATSYTFSVTGTNNFGTSAASTNSNSITANTVPQAPGKPTAAYASNTSVTLTFAESATGGSAITNYKYSTDGTNYITLSPAQTSSPLTITGLTAFTNYTFYIKAVNANGDSTASLASDSIYLGPIVSGGTLSSDATYYYRAFTSSSTFSFSGTGSLTADILTIAGGGAGGSGSRGAAGGAGGLVYSSSVSINSSQSITVGAGGPVGVWNDSNIAGGSTSGSSSQFGSLTAAVGGGRGGSYDSGGQASGGSGGGGWYVNGGASGTAGQGNSGGAGYSSPNYGGGGGGGAGSAGSQGTNTTGGAGGAGVSTYSSWGAATGYGHNVGGTYWFAGGGSGDIYGPYGTNSGTPGNGGGGTGKNPQASVNSACNGLDYTGGGGGSNGSGGKGIVIVRYTKSQVAA